MFENSFGDANALVRLDVLNGSQSNAWAEDDDYGMQDWELFAKLVLDGHRLEVVPKALYWYRTNSKRWEPNCLFGGLGILRNVGP